MVIAMTMENLDMGKKIIEKMGLVDPKRKLLGIAIRQKDFRTPEKRDQLIELANRLSENYSVLFIPFYYKNDTKIYDDIHAFVHEHVYFITEKYNTDVFMSLLENLDILMGSRLHSLIFSLVAEVPFIGISYDPKIENFMDMIEMQPVCSMDTFDPDKLYEAVITLDTDYIERKKMIIDAKHILKKRLLINDEMLKKVL